MEINKKIIKELEPSLKSLKYSIPLAMVFTGVELATYSSKSRSKRKINKQISRAISRITPVKETVTHPFPRVQWMVPGKLTTMYLDYQNIKKEIKDPNVNPIKKGILKTRKKLMDYFYGINKIHMTPWDIYKDWRFGTVLVDRRVMSSNAYPILRAHEEGVLNYKTKGLSFLPEIAMGTGSAIATLGTLQKIPRLRKIGILISILGGIGKTGKELYISSKISKEAKHYKVHTNPVIVAKEVGQSFANPLIDLVS